MLKTPSATQVPCLQTELPGPQARKLIAQDEQFTSPSYTRDYPLAVRRGYGMTVEDVDGNRFLDFTAGIAVCSKYTRLCLFEALLGAGIHMARRNFRTPMVHEMPR